MELGAYWRSLRYQPPRQLLSRLRYESAWKLYPRFPALVRAWCEPDAAACRPRPNFRWAGPPDHTQRPAPGLTLLARFQENYFDWPAAPYEIEAWIEAHPPGSWPAWHPYPTSLRIVNWIRALGSQAPARAAASLALQAAFLERNLEFHLGGNHLLENARALLAAGLYFQGLPADQWKQKGLELLRRELARQVLPDGGHYERAPYYHRRMTRLAEDAVELLESSGETVPPELRETAGKMRRFEQALRHQDGGLPWFHDSPGEQVGTGIPACPPSGLPRSFVDSGYYILEGPHGRLIADYGAPGAHPNPAHQHAGIFSFEVSIGECRMVVDAGTAAYEAGPLRDRSRATPAHSTVSVDGQDQFETWGAFRVGRRAWVGPVEERRDAACEAISAAHNGYARLGVEHRRTIVSLRGLGWLVVDDISGPGRLESFLHLGPRVAPVAEGRRIRLSPPDATVLPFGLARLPEILPDSCSPSPGRSEPSMTLRLEPPGGVARRFGYFLGVTEVRMDWNGSDTFVLHVPSGRASTVRLQKDDLRGLEVGYN